MPNSYLKKRKTKQKQKQNNYHGSGSYNFFCLEDQKSPLKKVEMTKMNTTRATGCHLSCQPVFLSPNSSLVTINDYKSTKSIVGWRCASTFRWRHSSWRGNIVITHAKKLWWVPLTCFAVTLCNITCAAAEGEAAARARRSQVTLCTARQR